MAFIIDCTVCQMQLAGLDTDDARVLHQSMEMEPESFACPVCHFTKMKVTIITEEEFHKLRTELSDNKGSKMFVSNMSVFPCPKCGCDANIRKILGHWRKCPCCGKWTRTSKIRWE